MLDRFLAFAIVGTLFVIAAPGCSSSSTSNVSEASCNACRGASYSDANCQEWGAAAGCSSSTFVATVSGCTNGCTFKECREPPSCTARAVDAGSNDAAPTDPRCAKTTDGFWSSKADAPCANPGEAKINGVSKFSCPCSGACPCGFQCGSIPLSVGGVISNVCAPG